MFCVGPRRPERDGAWVMRSEAGIPSTTRPPK